MFTNPTSARTGLSLLLICFAAAACPLASAASVNILNGIQAATTAGAAVQAHGGGMLKVGSYYYWFGENRNSDSTFYAVSCYRSTDLRNWEFRNNVLTLNSATELNHCNIERPKVVYNASTGQYVMWMHWENGVDYGQARCAVASCATVDGNYTYRGSFRPYQDAGVTDHGLPGYMSRDCTLFVDTDGAGYFVSAANENADLHLYRLTSDYLNISTLVVKLWAGQKREAPALFKRNGVYFLLTSAATGWTPNQQKYATSTSLASGWSALTNVGDSTCFYSQTAHVVPVQGSSGTSYLYMGDRWAGAWSGKVNSSTYVWLPITFPSSTSMSMSWSNTLIADTATGSLSGANYVFKFTNVNSGKVAEVLSASTADGATVDQYTDSSGAHQKWQLKYDGAGYFRLANVNSGKLMDVASGSTADGARVIQYTDNGGANQKWLPVDLGGGVYSFINKNSGKLLDVSGGSTANAAQLIQQTSNGSSHQNWRIGFTN